MSQESWVPDRLPADLTEKSLSVTTNFATFERIHDLAAESRVGPNRLVRRILAFGLMVAKSEEPNSDFSLIERDVEDQTESRVGLPLDGKGRTRLYKFGPLTIFFTSMSQISIAIGTESKMKVQGALGEELMTIANRYHTTVDNIMEGVLKVGIDAAEQERQGAKIYLSRDNSGVDKEMRFFG